MRKVKRCWGRGKKSPQLSIWYILPTTTCDGSPRRVIFRWCTDAHSQARPAARYQSTWITSARPSCSSLWPPDSPKCWYLWLWAVGWGRHPSTERTYPVFPVWTAVAQRLLLPPAWGRPWLAHWAQTAFLSLSLWFSKTGANILLHVETGEGEGKETGEQKQDKRHSGEKKKKMMKYNTKLIRSVYAVEMTHWSNFLLLFLSPPREDDRSVHTLRTLLRRNHSK